MNQSLNQLADLLTRRFIAQVHLLIEESGNMWHEHERVGDDDGTNTAKHAPQESLCIL